MFRSCVFIAFLVIATTAVTAQPIPKFDLFGGYSFGHIDTGTFPSAANLNGWDASLTYNWNRWFGVTAEGGGLYGSQQLSCQPPTLTCPQPLSVAATHQKIHTYSFGPRFYLRNHTRYTPFARALFGGGYTSNGFSDGTTLANGSSIWTTGAGVDIALTHRLALRTQTDFQRNRFFHSPGNDFRLATGLVWHLGSKP